MPLRQHARIKRQKYSNLTAWETVLVSRHGDRPQTMDYIRMVFEDFTEIHGDRAFGDDRAMRCGFARLGEQKLVVIGHQKGHTLQERQECMYGCAHPEGYRKAMRLMRLAEKFGIPIMTFIDTPGAYPGVGAEERGQSEAIGRNLYEMSELRVPIITTVIGEGGSGGALAISVADQVLMMQYSVYSVISPEGCASILWKSADKRELAAEAMGITAERLHRLKLVDDVIPEPLGGAHTDPTTTATTLRTHLLKHLGELSAISASDRLQKRYAKYRALGRFQEPEKAAA